MNPIKKFVFRAFQTVMKLAIPILPYRKPLVLHSIADIPGLLIDKGIDRVLIITDNYLHASGKLEPLKAVLKDHEIFYTIYDKTVPNPTIWNVEEAREFYINENCQALIGFGGGSSIDCSKAVGARIARPNKSLYDMKGILKVRKKIPLLIAVPTTAGSGSETAVASVITDDQIGHKFTINDFPLIPRVAVLDPEMTRSLPPDITATIGMDALTHAVEAYIGRSTTKDTRAAALEAAELVADNLENAYRDGNNMAARANMQKAAFLGGWAFSKSYVGYCHAVAHSLSGKYHTPHGLANAVLLPNVLEAYGDSIYKKAKDLAIAMHLAVDSTPADEATRRLIAHIRQMNANMNIPTTIDGIVKDDIPQMAKYAEKEANPLYPVPKLMTAKELEVFYEQVADWS